MPKIYDPIHDVMKDVDSKEEKLRHPPPIIALKSSLAEASAKSAKPAPNANKSLPLLLNPISKAQEQESEEHPTITHVASSETENSSELNSAETQNALQPKGTSQLHPDDPSSQVESDSAPISSVFSEELIARIVAESYKTKRRPKKPKGPYKSMAVLTSARSRHLKKEDGAPFLRKDIQYDLLKNLFENPIRAFSDPFPQSKYNVKTYDLDPPQFGRKRLTFAELYIKTIAHSSKCSKVLKDRLLNELRMSIPTSMICLLVNVGRMNTTINFVPDMKSQLRTYHPIPCLQINYYKDPKDGISPSFNLDKAGDKANDKQLQDTPRLKSILKACCDDTSEPTNIAMLDSIHKRPKTNVINLIFILFNAENIVNEKYFSGLDYNFFDIFMSSEYDPKDRCVLFLWLLYNYLETDLSDNDISKNPFGPKTVLRKAEEPFDVETPEELEFGERLYQQRIKFLAEDYTSQNDSQETNTPIKNTHSAHSSSNITADDPMLGIDPALQGTEGIKEESTESVNTNPNTATNLKAEEPDRTPIRDKITKKTVLQVASPHSKSPVESSHHRIASNGVDKSKINVSKTRKLLTDLRRRNLGRRLRRGLLRHEHSMIVNDKRHREFLQDPVASYVPYPNRPKLRNYKGDYVESSDKFIQIFEQAREKFPSTLKLQTVQPSISYAYVNPETDLALKEFKVSV